MNRASFSSAAFFSSSIALLCAAFAAAPAFARPIRIGVGSRGPISPQAMAQIQQLVAGLPNVTMVPVTPPGGVVACVKRFVAGEPDDRIDGVMIVSLPPNSFKAERGKHEATFTGTYEIWTLNLTTLAQDRHDFAFHDEEPVTGGIGALLTMPAQLLAQRTTGRNFIAGDVWQAYEAVQVRVESKLVAATRIYLAGAPIRNTPPLDPMETAQHLLDLGHGQEAMAVYRSIGVDKPEVQSMLKAARAQMRRDAAARLLGRTLGAIAGGDSRIASRMLADYAKSPAADSARAASLRTAIAGMPPAAAEPPAQSVIASDVPGLNQAAFAAMVKQMAAERSGSEPQEVILDGPNLTIADKAAPAGLKTRLDAYAALLKQSAELMSLKCGCAAHAWLTPRAGGPVLLSASFAPSSKTARVGLP